MDTRINAHQWSPHGKLMWWISHTFFCELVVELLPLQYPTPNVSLHYGIQTLLGFNSLSLRLPFNPRKHIVNKQDTRANIRDSMFLCHTIPWLWCWTFIFRHINLWKRKISQHINYMMPDFIASHGPFTPLHCIHLHSCWRLHMHALLEVNIFVAIKITIILIMLCWCWLFSNSWIVDYCITFNSMITHRKSINHVHGIS